MTCRSRGMYLLLTLAPLLSCALVGVSGRWLGARHCTTVTVLGLVVSTAAGLVVFHEVALQGTVVTLDLGPWFGATTVHVAWVLHVDTLAACLLLTVSLVSACVHLYAAGYMAADPHLPRFLCYLSLFTGAMLVLVCAADLLTLLVGWELIGVSSYLLIGFWVARLAATKAAQMALLVNRVSDTLLLLGLMASWWYVGTTDLQILATASTASSYANVLCGLWLGGALGKSAQVGLHLWLPHAMEGPTPVSALIHAATLVTAGIYLVARTSAVWEQAYWVRTALAYVGVVTSLLAASIGLVQTDAKRVIAYSTCSQLGYMTVAMGLGQYSVGVCHLLTHACFKALLFLGAGLLLHASADLQDLRVRAAAHAALPYAWTMLLLGTLSLVGWPFLAGYYSKDAVLEAAWAAALQPSAFGLCAYGGLMLVTALTSAYSFRLLYLAFVGPANASVRQVSRASLTPVAGAFMGAPLLLLAAGSVFGGYCLSEAALGLGTPFWAPSLLPAPMVTATCDGHMMPVWAGMLPLGALVLGLGGATAFPWLLPWTTIPSVRLAYRFAVGRWYTDEVYNQQVAHPFLDLGFQAWWLLDKGVLEALGPRGLSRGLAVASSTVRAWQTGVVHDYALVLQVLVIVGLGVVSSPQFWLMHACVVDPRLLTVLLLLGLAI